MARRSCLLIPTTHIFNIIFFVPILTSLYDFIDSVVFFFLFISDSFSFNQLSFYFGRVFSFGTNFFVALFWLLMLESSVFLWFYMTWYVMMYDTHVARLTHNSIKNRSPTTTKIRAFLLIIYLYMDNVCNTRNFGQIKSSRKRQRKKNASQLAKWQNKRWYNVKARTRTNTNFNVMHFFSCKISLFYCFHKWLIAFSWWC